MKSFLISIFSIITVTTVSAQYKVHSHNDYEQNVPFWKSLSAGVSSIEVDVFLQDKKLLVGHNSNQLQAEKTFETLYLEPLQLAAKQKQLIGKPLQLLIDIKTDGTSTLLAIVASLKKYPELINNPDIRFVISGRQPEAKDYVSYPDFIFFDYQKSENLTDAQWKKVALISADFNKYSEWNGKGRVIKSDSIKIVEALQSAHGKGKPFRFLGNGKPFRLWGGPDCPTAWQFFASIGIDYINTDKPFACVEYLNTLDKRTFTNTLFSEIYKPTYASDRKKTPVKNVILMIGDGNGLSQISSSVLMNNGELTLTQLKSIGLIKTYSSDNFATDSAAGATAFSTGKKTYNRAIGVDNNGKPLPTLCEILQKKGFSTGIITTDELTGATPASFFAHQKDRSMEQEIANDLLQSKLTFVSGGGKSFFEGSKTFETVANISDISGNKANRLAYFMSENGVPHALNGRGNLLAEVTTQGLSFLAAKKKPFFAMIEAAQIDSGGHANDTGTIVTEGIDFDRTISKVIEFADKNPGTLVIITADHETSGFAIPTGDMKNHKIEGAFFSDDHTATLIPVFAYGPHSEMFSGVYENTEIFDKILSILNVDVKN
ncbi:MAG: alkaline phosphatase [Flavobacterium psychrophilum]|nr:MAG: alkaline phosphatase [Flavobacterium psychrophilum]